jgi:hypothetical protein
VKVVLRYQPHSFLFADDPEIDPVHIEPDLIGQIALGKFEA